MSKLLTKVKNGTRKVTAVATDSVKLVVAVVAAAATAEAAFVGAEMLQNDVTLVKTAVKHKVSPEPVYTKKGWFGKKQISTINPITGKVEPYTGNKVPESKKVIKIK